MAEIELRSTSICQEGYAPWSWDPAQPNPAPINFPSREFVDTNLARAAREPTLHAQLESVEWLLRQFPDAGCADNDGDDINEIGRYFIPFLETAAASQDLDAVAETVFRAYLPIDLELPEGQLNSLIIEHLPESVTALPLERQIEFVCLIMALIHKESAFNPDVVSSAGAAGLMQLMPSTARGLSNLEGDIPLSDPGTNLEIGMLYLYQLYIDLEGDSANGSFFSQTMRQALIAYNRGRGGLDRLSPQEVETDQYQRRIMAVAQLYQRFYEQEFIVELTTYTADQIRSLRSQVTGNANSAFSD